MVRQGLVFGWCAKRLEGMQAGPQSSRVGDQRPFSLRQFVGATLVRCESVRRWLDPHWCALSQRCRPQRTIRHIILSAHQGSLVVVVDFDQIAHRNDVDLVLAEVHSDMATAR